MTDDYKPVLPEGFPTGASVNVADARYKAAVSAAQDHGLTQAQFSELLGLEARRAMARVGLPEPANSSFEKMSFAHKMVVSRAFKAGGG